jgi:putative transposase
MSSYKRLYVKNGLYFFTVITKGRKPYLHREPVLNQLRHAFRLTKLRYPFKTICYCILPDHMHFIWKLPGNEQNYSIRWKMIKSLCTQNLKAYGIKVLWQNRFWEHCIRDQIDFKHHFDYVHYNSVKHGYVDSAAAWKLSSFKHYAKLGVYTDVWGVSEPAEIKHLRAGE